MIHSWIWRALLVTVFALPISASAAVDAFTVLHFSDTHLGPYLAREAPPGALHGADTIAWLVREVAHPQTIPGTAAPAPAPDFAVVTGDITEYGVTDDTWGVVERAFADLPCPWYAVPGNHDNTWVALYDVMRRRHGGANHALDHQGWHFAFLCSASPQEPVPTLDATTRAWLRADLARLAPQTPIVLAMHHSPEIDEYANPAEMDTFVDFIRDYNVQFLLVGHGHSPRKHDVAGIPAIEGGSTFGDNAGYGLIHIDAERVRYDYRRFPGTPKAAGTTDAWETLHDAPLVQRRRLFELRLPAADAVVEMNDLPVRVGGLSEERVKAAELSYALDGSTRVILQDVDLSRVPAVKLPVGDLAEGAHLLTVSARLPGKKKDPGERRDLRTRIFYVERGATQVLWRKALGAAVKAGPVVAGDLLVVASTDGAIVGLDTGSGEQRWRFETGGEILATPAWSGELLVVGSGDGSVYALDVAGKVRWKQAAGQPVYGQPLIADGIVYVGDNGGNLHALALADGSKRWSFSRADHAIEGQPAVWNDAVYFGAWDGYLYSVQRGDGALRWKQLGPKSSTHAAFRYYAPADCGPLLIGDCLFVCDRGYHLGTFAADGVLQTNETLNVSAIAPADSNGLLITRHLDDRVRKLDQTGKTIWETAVPAGRFPIPPTVRDARVYVCSNTGLLSVLDAETGAKIWTYQATAGFYVMAPVAVADNGTCFVAGMDGTLTAVRQRAKNAG